MASCIRRIPRRVEDWNKWLGERNSVRSGRGSVEPEVWIRIVHITPDGPDGATAGADRDDTAFGILHSRFHESWALRLGTSLEDRPRYTRPRRSRRFRSRPA